MTAGLPLAQTVFAWGMTGFQAWALASVRLLVCWSLLPVFGRQTLPGLLRVGLAGVLSLGFVPLMQAGIAEASALEIVLMAVREVFVGICLGSGIAGVFWVVDGLAALIDAQSGAQAGAMLNPLAGNETGVFAGVMYWAFVAYFFSMGGLRWVVGILTESYRVWPPGVWHPSLPLPTSAEGTGWWLRLFDGWMAATVTLAAPVLVAMLMVELSLGLVGRFTPQLQVFFVAMPLKLIVALLVLALQVAGIFTTLGDVGDADSVDRWMARMTGGLGG